LKLGVERWFAVKMETIGPDPAGETHAMIVEWDDTARRQAEDELRRREAGADAVLRSSLDAVLTLNHRGVIESANPAAVRMFGWSEDHLIGRRLQQLFPTEGERDHEPSLCKALGGELPSLLGPERETHARRSSGSCFPAAMILFETAVGLYPIYTVVLRDLSEQKRAEEQIEKLAYHDIITGLPNRLLFRDRLDQALMQARRGHTMLGVLFLNIDRFKRINESWGHVAGDRLLSAVARRIEENVRSCDLVARWSGDEYNVLLPGIRGPEEAMAVANRIRNALRSPIEIDDQTVYVTVSMGLSTYPRDGADGDSLIRQADMAMYQAKRRGADVGEPSTADLTKTPAAHLHLDAELHRAVERGEFLVHYQPEVELASGRIVGVECLARWQHPTLGLLLPGVFIGPAEQSGLIVPLGRQVLEQACRQIAVWQQSVPGRFRVAVNLSLRQLRDPSLVEGVEELLRRTGIRPDWLDLEVTETVAISSVSRRLHILERLRALGVRMSLDDFGQGYSSLNRLRRLPVQTLKIDRAFVRRIRRDARDAAIVRTIIQMGHCFELQVVAEGVERTDEAEFLLAEGCDTAQGYLYSPPVPLEEFEKLWHDQTGERLAA
jgi:diguanylate cyclase (GGDEF)-like protein/PAS domain S-box-containing protein